MVEDITQASQTAGTGQYTFFSTTATASSSTSRLEFIGRQDPSWDALDDISVTDLGSGTAPEPAPWVLTALGLAALAARSWVTARRVAAPLS